jgi:nucleoside-diphosphate-sugar epimerase
VNILITGAAGFLGSHLAAHYRRQGHHLHLLSTQARRSRDSRLNWHVLDLEQPEALAPLKELMNGVDLCLFLAARVPFPRPIADVFNLNRAIDHISAEAFAVSNCRRAVYVSGLSVFSATQAQPVDESSVPEPQTDYQRGKVYGEELLLKTGHNNGRQVQVLRIQAPYGPGASPASITQVFVRNCLAGRTLEVHGDGSRRQHFTWAGDVGRAVDLLWDMPAGIYHFCGPRSVNMRELAEICLAELNPTGRYDLIGGDPGISCVEYGPDRLEEAWPRASRTGLPQGISELGRWVRENRWPLTELCP